MGTVLYSCQHVTWLKNSNVLEDRVALHGASIRLVAEENLSVSFNESSLLVTHSVIVTKWPWRSRPDPLWTPHTGNFSHYTWVILNCVQLSNSGNRHLYLIVWMTYSDLYCTNIHYLWCCSYDFDSQVLLVFSRQTENWEESGDEATWMCMYRVIEPFINHVINV